MVPIGNPIAVPRNHGFHERAQNSLVIHLPPSGTTSTGPCRSRDATYSASPTAKNPTATTTTSMPSASTDMPMVSRGWPLSVSVPISPANRPRASEASPRLIDEPSSAATVTNATTISAK